MDKFSHHKKRLPNYKSSAEFLKALFFETVNNGNSGTIPKIRQKNNNMCSSGDIAEKNRVGRSEKHFFKKIFFTIYGCN